MKKILSNTKTAIILLVSTVLFLGFYAYMIARPISYGMIYHSETVYKGITFEGTLKFYRNGKMVVKNINHGETSKETTFENYYYYKDGYVFNLITQTDEDKDAQISYINENFDEAVALPFSATKINAFKNVSEGPDGLVMTHTCKGAIIFAIVGGIVSASMIALTASSFLLSKKSKDKEQD